MKAYLPKLEEGWLTVGLLCAMMAVSAGGVAAAGWADHLHAAWVSGIVGILAGLALAKSRFSGPTVIIFATVYGIFTVGFFIALGLDGTWHARSVEIIVRLNDFIYTALFGGTSRDALPFPVTVALIFWYIGVLNAWSVFRRASVWPAIIPAGVGLLVNAYYYLGPVRMDLYLAVYVLLALMFVARMNLLVREREWQSARVLYSPDLRFDFLRAGLILALAGVLIAWAAPSLAASPQVASSWRRMAGSFTVVRESWMRMFAAVRGYGQAYNDFYGDLLVLGGPSQLSNNPIMDIRVTGVSDDDERFDDVLGPIERFYWRATTYSVYDDGSWRSGQVEFRDFDPNRTHLVQAEYRQRRQVSLSVTMHLAATSRLYTPTQPQWVDRPANVEITLNPQGSVDVSSIRAQQVVRRGETYQVVASVSVADSTSLREAATAYPAWVADNFLRIPASITPRTRALAQQIVDDAGAVTPFDKAEAITQWLRENIVYDQLVDAPPSDVEPVDFLLFTSRRGYCNYYATAAVIMLRSLGVPSRMAVGMAQGTIDPRTNTYSVLEENAHAWPEIFFPGYGWVEFEPTVAESPIARPERIVNEANQDLRNGSNVLPGGDLDSFLDRPDLPAPDDFFGDDFGTTTAGPTETLLDRVPWAPLTVGVLTLIGALLVAGILSFRVGVLGWENMGRMGAWVMRRRGLFPPSAVGAVYVQLERVANWLGLAESRAVTPNERAQALTSYLPEVRHGVERITEEYVTEQYSPRTADMAAAARAWRGIRFKLWLDALRSYLLVVLEDDPLPDQELLKLKHRGQGLFG